MAFHGRQDTVVPYALGLNAFNSIESCADPKPTAEMIFTTYDNVGKYHDAWIPAYDTTHTYHNPNLYEWLLLQSRDETVVAVSEETEYQNKDQGSFSIYPNPAKDDIVHLLFDEQPGEHHTLKIWSSTGELVVKEEHEFHQINIGHLSTGVYIVQLTSNSGYNIIRRLIKMKLR